MTTKLKRNQQKEYAKSLFLHEQHLTQKEIAERVEVSEKTLSRWVNDPEENWEVLRASLSTTKEEQLRRIYDQINELTSEIQKRPKGKRFADSKEADTLLKLGSAASKLENEAAIGEIIEVCKLVVNYLRPLDLDKAKEITAVFDAFIKDRLRKS